ncbi:MAG: DMT family transporter [Nitrospirota bacterium]
MTYLWVVLSLISAFSLATSDAFTKKALKGSNEYLVAWFRLLFTMPLLIVIWLFIPVPELDKEFYRAFFIALPIELVTVVLYIKALKLSPLSLTLPFLALTPVFLIFNAYFIVGEKVSFIGGAGIFSIAFGSYLLNIKEIRKGILEPLKAISREKGSILMICVALLYSFTSSLGKMAIEHSSPLFFGITYFIALTVLFAPVGLWMGRGDLNSFVAGRRYLSLIIPGLFYGLMIATHMTAMKLTKVAYMISIKRASLLIGVLYGYILFREENIKGRALGALLMFIGFVMVVSAK